MTSPRRTVIAVAASTAAAVGLMAGPALAKPASGTLWVSSKGGMSASCAKNHPCKTIARAVKKAKPGSKIMVAKGVYREEVMITKRLAIIGVQMPTIEAKGMANGVMISGPEAAGSKVKGFVIQHASFEGILAVSTMKVKIMDNLVRHNDAGMTAKKLEGECAPQGPVPGDCGEGLHLMSVTGSKVIGNKVSHNAGGILLTDELGPTAHNTIEHNKTLNNLYDCGITLASHSEKAVSKEGALQPKEGGVYDNRVMDNVSNGNGVKGEGAGILIAAAAPGTGAYGNLVKGNTANNNGLAGITVHSHAPGQDVNGNRIIANKVSHDGVTGNKGKPGDEDAGLSGTVGILVWSGVAPLQGTVISHNKVAHVHYGIWTKNAKAKVKANMFSKVKVKITQM